MPEATIDKDGHALAAKHEVWLAKHRLTPSPARNVVLLKQSDHTDLGIDEVRFREFAT